MRLFLASRRLKLRDVGVREFGDKAQLNQSAILGVSDWFSSAYYSRRLLVMFYAVCICVCNNITSINKASRLDCHQRP